MNAKEIADKAIGSADTRLKRQLINDIRKYKDEVFYLCLQELEKLKDEYQKEKDKCEEYSSGYWMLDHKIDALIKAIERIERS